ncbi:MAG TPA: ATP-binding protein, partial [Trebonia sp.]
PERQDWQAAWPRQDFLELAAVTEAVPSARHHARLVFKEWQAGELGYEVEQVAAELVANAVAATQSITWTPKQPPVRLWLLGRGDLAMVVVGDATTAIPVPRQPVNDDESGRGLLLVGALARWGYYLPPPGYGGKIVYALLPKDPK